MSFSPTWSRRETGSLVLTPLPLAEPWHGFLLPVSAFPIPASELGQVRRLLEEASGIASTGHRWQREVLIQFSQLHRADGVDRFYRHAQQWGPELGLGVFPDREPPTLWKAEEFANLEPGDAPRVLMHKVFRITTTPEARLQARNTMVGIGCVLELMLPEDPESFYQRATEYLLAKIEEPSFTSFPFYVPLLNGQSLAAATSQSLPEWLSGAEFYVRESVEDHGILIVSRHPLEPVWQSLGARLLNGSPPVWQLPYQ